MKAGISKGKVKHLMRVGVNTVKNFKGVAQTSKYYFSQTYKVFYKRLFKDSIKEFSLQLGVEFGVYNLGKTRSLMYA